MRTKFQFKTTAQKLNQVCLKHQAKDMGGDTITFWIDC